MSADTKGKIKGYVSPQELYDYIVKKYDKEATIKTTIDNYGLLKDLIFDFERQSNNLGFEDKWAIEVSFIDFKDGENYRSLFCSYNNINTYENLSYYQEIGLEEMVKAETTNIVSGCCDKSENIITDIVSQFGGGWVDKNDCDGIPYEEVEGRNILYQRLESTIKTISYKNTEHNEMCLDDEAKKEIDALLDETNFPWETQDLGSKPDVVFAISYCEEKVSKGQVREVCNRIEGILDSLAERTKSNMEESLDESKDDYER